MLRRVGVRAAAVAFAAAAATTAIAEPSVPSHRQRKSTTGSPFSYRELEEAIARRRDQERALATYVNTVAPMLASARDELARAQRSGDPSALERARARFATLAARAQAETASLTWGSPDGQQQRANFVRKFGCVGWTEEALAEIAKHGPIVEMGAGEGQWQRALSALGVDVLAYDDQSAVPGTNDPPGAAAANRRPARRGKVLRGDETKLRSYWVRRKNRTLLIVYPEGDFFRKCLENYEGEVVLYVGEGRGGVNGPQSTFDHVERTFDVERVVRVRPFRDGHERLWVLRRKKKNQRTA
jgi:hypothetical protein